ncbi:right-handed parallel beta-helix repeat-containing protein [Sabulilitoribacter arenilitoris]|uniref:Right-handed parallel beta-helix repeat-containing protein n=1 Tax=Wocania arenilitoris TaxID=2044858 RepID=A0AAE3JNG1_9FLAO|nr:right-handed parallel beta-helix repeat-containing protein [Wocania arenilitoris]MCF7568641.1 right-handed parallel beta-helix repeat-containing protein [Wocania arenilitoris]
MKAIMKTLLFTFLFMASMMSCNKEELFVEPEVEVVEEDTEDPDTTTTTPAAVDTTLPCDFTLSSIEANTTVIINCVMDLGGETINLPENVTIVYEGGDIINGTINFSGGSTFDGNFLNATLTIGGTTPLFKDPIFNFDPKRWGIVEGVVNDEVAYNNKIVINDVMKMAKELGITTIKIDAINAYFQTQPEFVLPKQTPQDSAIQVPADMHVIMTDNSHLWVQPNNYKNTVLITLFEADNAILEGGVLHGDRDTHDYSDTSSKHEWGHLVLVKASYNATVKGMTLMDAGGDGININSLGHTYDAHYTPADNILITNNKILRARRLGMSITGGKNIIIEYNEIIDSGVDTEFSNGTAPRWAIDIEPVWANGIKYETVDHVIIRNNIERGSVAGGFINARGSYITYENNDMESTIAIGETTHSIVRNNTFKRNPNSTSLNVAIYAGDDRNYGYGNELNHSNEVYGNTITDFDNGIFLQDPGMDLHHNTMINCKSGIQIIRSRDSKIRENTIISNVFRSEGIGNKTTNYADNIDIYSNTIEVKGSPFRFTGMNLEEENKEYSITIRDNELTSIDNNNSSFNKIRGFDFKNNVSHNSGIRTIYASNANIIGNTFQNGIIRISEGCSDLSFIDNIVTDGRCFQDDNTDAVNIVKENNTCD